MATEDDAKKLGRRLIVTADHGERRTGDVWGIAIWGHPDQPLHFAIEYEGDSARWELRRPSTTPGGDVTVHASGQLDQQVAASHIQGARLARMRRLAAQQMLDMINQETGTKE